MRPVDLHPGLFQPEPLDIADDADGGDHGIDLQRLGLSVLLDMGDDLAPGLLQLGDLGAFADLHSLFLEGFPGEGGDFLILDGKNALHHLDDRGFGPERVEKAREFDPDGA